MSHVPKISYSILVNTDLHVDVHKKGGIIPNVSIVHNKIEILPDSKLNKWSQLISILVFLQDLEVIKNNINTLVTQINFAFENLIEVIEKGEDTNENVIRSQPNILRNILDQFLLVFMKKTKYNVHVTLNAFLIYMQSMKCYDAIRINNILLLPHPRFLQKHSPSLKFLRMKKVKAGISYIAW